jgi:hypothetical protein
MSANPAAFPTGFIAIAAMALLRTSRKRRALASSKTRLARFLSTLTTMAAGLDRGAGDRPDVVPE